MGDLVEEFFVRASADRVAASIWLWVQVLRSAPRAVLIAMRGEWLRALPIAAVMTT